MSGISVFIEKTKQKVTITEPLTKVDKEWLQNSYLIDLYNLKDNDRPNAYWSNAYLKYTDTSLGGNYGINTKYGFTPSADVPIAGRLSGRKPYQASADSDLNYGMGRKYSETFDDNEQILFLEMGDAKFNSLFSYVTNAMDYGTAVVANTGRSLTAYRAGQAVGSVVGVIALFTSFPLWGAALVLGGVTVAKLLTAGSDFTYYKLDPSMYKYWRAVNTMSSQLFVEMGICNPELKGPPRQGNIGLPAEVESELADRIRELIPGLITPSNYVDVFAVANRTQVLTNEQKALEYQYFKEADGKVFTYADTVIKKETQTLAAWLDDLFKIYSSTGKIYSGEIGVLTDNNGVIDKIEGDNGKPDKAAPKNTIYQDKSVTVTPKEISEKREWLDEVFRYINSSLRFGADAATFRVEYTGPVTETFSNSVKDIPIKDTINNVSRKVKDVKFSLSGGNLISDNLDKAMNYLGDMALGAIDGITFGYGSNIATALLGGGYFDVPKMWDDSTFEYQKHTFKMRLGGPYGHPLSQAQDIYIPLIMLICAVGAQSVGKAGYTTPMLCRPFIKGIMNPSLAIMDSLVIERGVSNMGFDKRDRPLAIDVSFSFVDLSSFVTVPVEADVFSGFLSALDDSSPTARYIQMLAGRDYYTTKYAAPKARMKWYKLKNQLDMMTNPSVWGTKIGQAIGGTVVGALVEGFTLPATQRNFERR